MRKLSAFIFICAAFACADPYVTTTGIGARAYGMAGNFTALADDFSAVFWNPAGLAFVPVREVHCSFDGVLRNAETVFGGRSSPAFSRRFRITSAGLLQSVPTVQGGFAFALGFSSPWLLDDLTGYSGADVYRGSAGIAGAGDTLFPGDTLFIDKYSRRADGRCNLWNAGLGWQIAPGLGFGFSIGLLTGKEGVDLSAVSRTARSAFEDFDERMERVYFGYDVRLGLLYVPSRSVSAGLRVELPRRATVAENRGFLDYLEPGGSATATDFGVLRSGWAGAAGIAFKLPSITFSGDADFSAPVSGAPGGSGMDMDTWKWGAGTGIEAPLRFLAGVMRCGYSYAKVGLRSMGIRWNDYGFEGNGSVQVERNRHLLTAGYSLYLGTSVSLELAYGAVFWKISTDDKNWLNDISERYMLQRGAMSLSIRY